MGLLQPLPGNFWSNDIISGSLLVTWGHLTSFPITLLPPGTSHRIVGAQAYPKHDLMAFYSQFQETSGEITTLPGTSGYVGSRESFHVT